MCNSCSRRATCASSARTFASSGLRSAGFAPRFFAANSRSEPLRRRLAPSRQMRAVQPLAAKQAAHLAGLCAAIRLLQNPQPILCGELAPLRLGHNLRVRGRSGAAGPGGLEQFDVTPTARQRRMVRAQGDGFVEEWARRFVQDKFGSATTHWHKLQERIERGVGNPCPLLLIGIPAVLIYQDRL